MGITIGFSLDGESIVGKNSLRSVDEPQCLEYHPARIQGDGPLEATYISVHPSAERLSLLLSRPVWSWGGEAGLNEAGVMISMEPVRTRGPVRKEGLTPLDLTRLGLEGGSTAKEALHILIDNLERYGQGGNIGYTSRQYRDGTFLIADREEQYLLETADRSWTYKALPEAVLTGRYAIGADGEAYSQDQTLDFRKEHSGWSLSPLLVEEQRKKALLKDREAVRALPDLFRILSRHRPQWVNPLREPALNGPCVHAGPLHPEGITASLIAELGRGLLLWATGCSAPCLSLYKPWTFGFHDPDPFRGRAVEYWLQREQFHRLAIGKKIPREFFAQKQALQEEWVEASRGADKKELEELFALALRQESEFYGRWRGALLKPRKGGRLFLRFWTEHDKILSASHFEI